MKKTYILILIFFMLVSACETEEDLVQQRLEDNPPPSAPTGDPGNADFSNYVALGNSLAAGYMDGALYNDGQANSFPAILAKQLSLAGGGVFNQPNINSQNGYNNLVSDPENGLILGHFYLNTSVPGPEPVGAGELITYTEKGSPTFWGAVTLKNESSGLNDFYPQWFKMESCTRKDSVGDK